MVHIGFGGPAQPEFYQHLLHIDEIPEYGELKVLNGISTVQTGLNLTVSIRFEYVKYFEQPDVLLPNTWIVIRLDGRGFHKSVPNSFPS